MASCERRSSLDAGRVLPSGRGAVTYAGRVSALTRVPRLREALARLAAGRRHFSGAAGPQTAGLGVESRPARLAGRWGLVGWALWGDLEAVQASLGEAEGDASGRCFVSAPSLWGRPWLGRRPLSVINCSCCSFLQERRASERHWGPPAHGAFPAANPGPSENARVPLSSITSVVFAFTSPLPLQTLAEMSPNVAHFD